MSLPHFPARHVANHLATRRLSYGETERAILNLDAFETARHEISSWPGYAATPLLRCAGIADALGLGAVYYKDESHRFHLESFKALGGAYAVLRVVQRHLLELGAGAPSAAELIAGENRDLAESLVVATATDGNHGRSVAWGARMFGCRCIIYLHEHVSAAREAEIALLGAQIIRVPGHYDDSVRRCAQDADLNGWVLVADTSDDEKAVIPAMVMQGYTLLAQEILDVLPPDKAPSHVFVPAGVGGLAAAIGAHYWERLGEFRPRLVVVEPMRADCIFRTVSAGRPVAVEGGTETFMACLAAGETSAPAWVILKHAVDDVIALEDSAAEDTMRLLAKGVGGDLPIVSGESGCAATAGLIAAALSPPLRAALGLDESSRVVVIGSEGATDADTYRRVVGRTAAEVAAREPQYGGRPVECEGDRRNG